MWAFDSFCWTPAAVSGERAALGEFAASTETYQGDLPAGVAGEGVPPALGIVRPNGASGCRFDPHDVVDAIGRASDRFLWRRRSSVGLVGPIVIDVVGEVADQAVGVHAERFGC
jgi:hypothetical protein